MKFLVGLLVDYSLLLARRRVRKNRAHGIFWQLFANPQIGADPETESRPSPSSSIESTTASAFLASA